MPSYSQTIDGVDFVLAQSQAQSLFDAIYSDTLGQWVQQNPSWVNPL